MTPEQLAALHAQCFTTPRPWSAAEFRNLLAQPGCFLVSRPQGFVLGRVIADEVELLTIAVAPQARRHGLGRTLLQAFEHQAQACGARQAFLEVADDNQAAIALYRGYAQAGLRKDYYQSPRGARVHARVLRKSLGADG